MLKPCIDCRVEYTLRSRCVECERLYSLRRGTTANRGYGAKWKRLSQSYLRTHRVCVFCGAVDDLTVDHIVPLSRGGNDDRDNLQTLCRSCNSGKRDR